MNGLLWTKHVWRIRKSIIHQALKLDRHAGPMAAQPAQHRRRSEVNRHQILSLDPLKSDLGLAGSGRSIGKLARFHVEHRIDLVMPDTPVVEAGFDDRGEFADDGGRAEFFVEFASECRLSGFTRIDVPAGKEKITLFPVLTEQNGVVLEQDASGDELGLYAHGDWFQDCADWTGGCDGQIEFGFASSAWPRPGVAD